MTIKADKWIRRMAEQHDMISPFESQQVRMRDGEKIISYGVSSYGYDVRCARDKKVDAKTRSKVGLNELLRVD